MKIFIETTIPSYLAARPSKNVVQAGHQQITRAWWDGHRHHHELFTSPLVVDEAATGDAMRAAERLVYLSTIEVLKLSDAALALAGDIMFARILPPDARVDAAHIAVATVNEMDILLTWNCRHIANAANQRPLENLLNSQGLRLPVICTPEQLMETDNENPNDKD